jgi:hypothetical protein
MVKQIVLKLVLLLAVLGAATLLFMPAVSAGGGTVTCTTFLTGPIDANVDVPAGQTCTNTGFEITGNVTVEGTLLSLVARYDKNVIVTGSGSVHFNICLSLPCGGLPANHVVGNVSITGSSGDSSIEGSIVEGNVNVEGTSGEVVLQEASLNGNVNIDGNTGSVAILDVRIGKNLNCDGNVPAPIIFGYVQANKKTGQCAA